MNCSFDHARNAAAPSRATKMLAFSRLRPSLAIPASETKRTPMPAARLFQDRPTVRADSRTVPTRHAAWTMRRK